jgi:Outer membrane protein beta-barrel domain
MKLILLLLTMGTLTVNGQTVSSTQAHRTYKKTRIGFNISPDYNYRTLNNSGDNAFNSNIVNARNAQEKGRPGFTAGANIGFNLTDNTGFEAGIQYSDKGYQTDRYNLVYAIPEPLAPVKIKFIYRHHYIDVPLTFNFIQGRGKLRFIATTGIAVNILLKSTVIQELEYTGGRTDRSTRATTSNYRKINISPLISAGVDYKINDKTCLRVAPVFRYGLLKNIDAPITERLWNAGLNIGCYYSLK